MKLFLNKSLFWLIYMNNKLKNNKQQNHSFEYYIFFFNFNKKKV